MYDLIIIGGGAAGLFAAACAGQFPGGKGLKGLILEGGREPGQKLLLTGAGQCNLTHGGSIREFPAHYGKNGGKIRSALYGFSNEALCRFLESAGLETVEREDGKIYPASFSAHAVRDFLVSRAEENGFGIRCGLKVRELIPEADGFRIRTEKEEFSAEKVLVCTGGCSYPATGSDGSLFPLLEELGLEVTPPKPALVPVNAENYPYGELSGASVPGVRIAAEEGTAEGDLLFTHRAFSGPAALHISRYVKPGKKIVLNYCPAMSREEAREKLKAVRQGREGAGGAKQETFTVFRNLFVPMGLPEALLRVFFETEKIDPHRRFSESSGAESERILDRIFRDSFTVSGTAGFSQAMVTCGGVALPETATKTFESKRIPGLYFAGEVLDVDGDTGGYNLQFAFSSARAAIKDICGKKQTEGRQSE